MKSRYPVLASDTLLRRRAIATPRSRRRVALIYRATVASRPLSLK